MKPTVKCPSCGSVLGVPKSGIPADGLPCNWCGYVITAAPPTEPTPPPSASSAAAPEPEAPARRPRSGPPVPPSEPDFFAEAPLEPSSPGAPHRWADDEDDNGQPYVLPPNTETKLCEACKKPIPIDSVVCVRCGFDSKSKKKVERKFSAIDKEWENGWSLQRRLALFGAMQGINLLTLIASIIGDYSLGVSICGVGFSIVLQAFIFGTYERVRVRRNRKGQAEIIITWRACFIPLTPKKVNWRDQEQVVFGHYDATGITDWWICLILLGWGCIPGIIWWWCVIRSDRFFTALSRDHGAPNIYLYRGMNEATAREIAQVTTDATGLALERPL